METSIIKDIDIYDGIGHQLTLMALLHKFKVHTWEGCNTISNLSLSKDKEYSVVFFDGELELQAYIDCPEYLVWVYEPGDNHMWGQTVHRWCVRPQHGVKGAPKC